MSIPAYYTCKKCGAEIECEVVINEECDLPETCPECGEPVPDSAYADMEEQAIARAADWRERSEDR